MNADPRRLLRYERSRGRPDRFETGGITVTEVHILAFAGLTGDFFDLHMDDDYARSLGFPAGSRTGCWAWRCATGSRTARPSASPPSSR